MDTEKDSCSEGLVGLQRGASNVWFADVQSAITVDRGLTEAELVLEKILPELQGIRSDDVAVMLGIKARQHGVPVEDLIATYRNQTDTPTNHRADRRRLRDEEYEALGRSHPEEDRDQTFVNVPSEIDSTLRGGETVDLVSRVTRLREVRALSGFTRVSAASEGAAPSGRLTRNRNRWLPAIEVLGEGVFVRLRESHMTSWENSEFAQERAALLNEARRRAAPDKVDSPEPISPRLILIHSLSHALLRELSLDTGYPTSSIRERVYADPGQSGILLYTATADAAGSLGGLCSHGTPDKLTQLILSATDSCQWCSADPVCLESVATGTGAANLAACHSCMLAPEVSCEFQNRYLDRACLVGTAEARGGFLTLG